MDLAAEPRFMAAHPAIDACRSLVAVERGPVVYCFEEADLPVGVRLQEVAVNIRTQPVPQRFEELDDCIALRVRGEHRVFPILSGMPYYEATAEPSRQPPRPIDLLAVPYNLWGNRRGWAMKVWMPKTSD
jgi:DUF1680 family protein